MKKLLTFVLILASVQAYGQSKLTIADGETSGKGGIVFSDSVLKSLSVNIARYRIVKPVNVGIYFDYKSLYQQYDFKGNKIIDAVIYSTDEPNKKFVEINIDTIKVKIYFTGEYDSVQYNGGTFKNINYR